MTKDEAREAKRAMRGVLGTASVKGDEYHGIVVQVGFHESGREDLVAVEGQCGVHRYPHGAVHPYMTQIGASLYLTPSGAAMSREHMATWFRARGVQDAGYLDELLTEHAGKTEDEMDRIYDEMHC